MYRSGRMDKTGWVVDYISLFTLFQLFVIYGFIDCNAKCWPFSCTLGDHTVPLLLILTIRATRQQQEQCNTVVITIISTMMTVFRFRNRMLHLHPKRFGVDCDQWLIKVMCGSVEFSSIYMNNHSPKILIISRLSCERAGTRWVSPSRAYIRQ